MPNVTFVNWNKTLRVGALSNLRRVAKLAGIPLYNGASRLFNCHGAGVCGTCHVHVEPADGLTPPTALERLRGCTGPVRLACQALVASERRDLRVTKLESKRGRPVPGPGIPSGAPRP
jgi:ferredoxin